MMDLNLTTLFDDFYHTRFFVLVCLSVFTLLFSLRLDNTLKCSYWIIFIPLWIWKLAALIGMIVGSWSWIRLSRRRFEGDTFVHYKAMLISFTTNIILFLFELIVCEKLETNRSTPWSICFIPLFILSLLSIGTCIWSIRYERSYEIELFCSLNILQFIFIALRLDYTITWSWVLVLIPLWIIMCISFIIILYIIILTIVMTRSSNSNHNFVNQSHPNFRNNQQKWSNAILYTIFVISLLVFEILLTNKLDYEMSSTNLIQHFQNLMNNNNHNHNHPQNNQILVQSPSSSNGFYYNQISHNVQLPGAHADLNNNYNFNSQTHLTDSISFFTVTIPLYVSYLSLMLLSFNSHSGNTWWFGMRRDFCEIFLLVCPIFKIYGNIQYKSSSVSNFESNSDNNSNNNTTTENRDQSRNLLNNSEPSQQLVFDRSNEVSITTFNNQHQNFIAEDINSSIDLDSNTNTIFQQPPSSHMPLFGSSLNTLPNNFSISSSGTNSKRHRNSISRHQKFNSSSSRRANNSTSSNYNRQHSINSTTNLDRNSIKSNNTNHVNFITNQSQTSSVIYKNINYLALKHINPSQQIKNIVRLDMPD